MNDDVAFVDEIRRHPDDVVPRLIYADYLEETGNPRGEFIRIQCQVEELAAGDPQRAELFNRERELLDRHGDEWVSPLREFGVAGVTRDCLRRGLLERARMPAGAFLQYADQLCMAEPALAEIGLTGVAEHVESLTAMQIPRQISRLDLSACQVDVDIMRRLTVASWWSQLTSIDLRFNSLLDEGVQLLVNVDAPQLMHLNLSSNQINPAGASILGNSPLFSRLQSLDLSMNPIGSVGLIALGAGRAQKLGRLNLSRCRLNSVEGLDAGFEALEELVIRSNQISNWSPLASRIRSLRHFDGRANPAPVPDGTR